MNQAVSFGLLLGGGALVVSSLTGQSLADIAKGKTGHITTTGASAGGGSSSGVSTNGVSGIPGTLTNLATGNNPRGTAISGATDPVRASGLTVERIDQGQDFADTGGTIVSPTAGQIVSVTPVGQGWEGGGGFVEHLASGAYIYFEEGVSPLVHAGENVLEGQTLANLIPSFHSGVEAGFAAPGGSQFPGGYQTQATATTGYTEGQVTQAGQAFAAWLKSVGF